MAMHLLILGASVRAAAQSALRAGLRPWGADLFCDTDLPTTGSFERVGEYPEGFLQVADDGPPGPWLYTGALENHPEVVEKISARRILWGNGPPALERIRSPEFIFQVLKAADLPCPAVCLPHDVDPGRRWLLKPRFGSAGRGIAHWPAARSTEDCYLQELIDGEACAALYVALADGPRLIGVTRQLVGQDWLHAKSFRYCGSIGPIQFADGALTTLERIGRALTDVCHLRGLFGVDFILRDGVPYPVEVNPRYTASVEVIELARRFAALELHRQAFSATQTACSVPPETTPGFVGKAVLFARTSLRFPEDGPWRRGKPADIWSIPEFADVPRAGTQISAGKPILTLFTSSHSLAECETRLRQIAADLDRLLFHS
jgi:uncharacterized protein